MRRLPRWFLVLFVLLLVVPAAAVFALWHWAGSEDVRLRAQAQATQALGVPVTLSGLSLSLWPLPSIAAAGVRIDSRPAITLQRVEARPAWGSLLRGRPAIDALVVREAVLPQQAVVALAASLQKPPARGGAPGGAARERAAPALPRHILLDRVTWMDAKGQSLTVDADVTLSAEGFPENATASVRAGRFEGASATLRREGDTWALHAKVGGGTVAGPLQLTPARPGGAWRLQGQLVTDGVEIAALTAPSRTLTGRLDARTTLQAEFREAGELAQALRTQTRFTVRQAVVHGLDLAQAVRTIGTSRGGRTPLETLAGQVATQGRAVQLTQLVASSGALAATGQVAISPARALSGRVTVELAGLGGALGVPLVVGGTLDAPSVTLSRGALAGAALGTALMPGVGTGAGATLGDRIGQGLKGWFGK